MIVDVFFFFFRWSNHMECFGLAHAEVKYRFLSVSKNIYTSYLERVLNPKPVAHLLAIYQ